jgi:hypothetical protein
MREYLFCASTGFYVLDKPKDFEWGPGELDPRQFAIVRTVKPSTLKFFEDSHDQLVNHRLRLKQPLAYSGMRNIWLDGALEKTPERDWVPAPEYVVLRTGRRCKEEEELWGCVIEGDRAFHSPSPLDPDARGMLLTIESIEPRKFSLQRDVTLREAEEGHSAFGFRLSEQPAACGGKGV